MPLIDEGFEALLQPFYSGKKLTDPISTKEDKFQLLPAFLKVKGESPIKPCFSIERIGNFPMERIRMLSFTGLVKQYGLPNPRPPILTK